MKPNNLQRQGVGMTSMRTRRRLIKRLREQGISNEKVLSVIEQTPRHLFIDEALAHKAYEDTALPIGRSQTISQPFVVARMTELLLAADIKVHKVLEIGTGCGYQSAILSQLVRWVCTVERINSLLDEARKRLPELGYRNISYLSGDGFLGWSSNAPFDGILVAAAPMQIPQELLKQLALNARMIIPVGGADGQKLKVITRTDRGFVEQQVEAVRFVPMLGGRN